MAAPAGRSGVHHFWRHSVADCFNQGLFGRAHARRAGRRRVQMSSWIVFLARLFLVLLFLPFSALDKVLNFKGAIAQASEATATPWIAKLLILAGFALEVSMSAAVLAGFADRLAAFT